jgi:hypothetical protein
MSLSTPADTIVLDFGKYKGIPLTRVNAGYLRWMVNQHGIPEAWRELAGAELSRRGTTIPGVEITAHAIDRASLRLYDIYVAGRQDENEGLHGWLSRMVLEAREYGLNVPDGRSAKVEGNCRDYYGVRWVIEEGVEYPTLVTVYAL